LLFSADDGDDPYPTGEDEINRRRIVVRIIENLVGNDASRLREGPYTIYLIVRQNRRISYVNLL
jgi:hypothetical protein